ncbi:MAG: protein kinase domain-containing protein [Pyrinomonadaceae bacterium]
MKYCTVCKAKYEDSVSFCPVDGEVLEDDPSSLVGTVLDGQYQIEALLGKGGMGAVFRARHILLGDRVAIKILPPEVRTNAEWLRRFRREGQASRRFRHPNAVTVYDLRTAGDGTIYMVMEFVEGRTLSEEIKMRGRCAPGEAFEILEPIMSVLNTAHTMGVVHRDLKPENIMIGKATTGEPVVKLLDLGIAKLREIAGGDGGNTTALTTAGQVLGTPYYMSPEQWGELPRDGDPEIDGRADIYSLGLVFYEMIVGKRPYSGKTLHQLRQEHISVTPTPLNEIVPDVPMAFSKAIGRATAKDRGDRPATAGEFAAELRAAIDKQGMSNLARTLPDLPHIVESKADTSSVGKAPSTKSDLEAPTILTVDSSASDRPVTSPGHAPASTGERPMPTFPREVIPAQYQSASDSGASMDMGSSLTIPQMAKPAVPAEPSRRGPMLLAGAGVFVLVLLFVGVGGFFAIKWLSSNSGANSNEIAGKNNAASNGSTGADAKDLGRYWLELLPESLIGDPVRVAGVVPLASGQSFKFHFRFNEDGYLYIVGPGEQNRPTAFLTAEPSTASGLESNAVTKDVDFSFPSGMTRWLQLDTKPGTEDYTIIFSPTPLTKPEFLKTPATGGPLTEQERADLATFLTSYKAGEPLIEVNDKNANNPFVTVKTARVAPAGNPSIFEIRIQHK